ncbi:hypothetical protein [Psychrobacter sp. M13]|uniref:hypothetical protein n=1 Tax=Psychrobacter sp. M13 TaxID=3067275 RepID=UPI00273A7F61|nr:hypothetical protein [Psychrobacter sp. M13]WLP95933.1 hypothetical protein Q9G97_13475 [Psychrobacter sp. M13]
MSDQQLHDDIKNIVSALKGIIPILQSMGDTASDTIDKRLDSSLDNVDVKVNELSHAITQLKQSVDYTERSIVSADRQALRHLKQGVERFVNTDVNDEYSRQISQVIARLEPLVERKINDAIDKLVEHKKLFISNHNEQVDEINDKLETNMATIQETLLETIEKMSKASAAASTKFDKDLAEIEQVAEAHTIALQSVKNSTDTTAQNMKVTLTSIKRSATFMSQSPATMTVMGAGFLALCLIASIVYINELWIAMFISIIVLGSFLAMIWGFMAWLDTKE